MEGNERGVKEVFQGVAYAGSWLGAHLDDHSDQVCSREWKMRREGEKRGEGRGKR